MTTATNYVHTTVRFSSIYTNGTTGASSGFKGAGGGQVVEAPLLSYSNFFQLVVEQGLGKAGSGVS